jgi:hypothetical protein
VESPLARAGQAGPPVGLARSRFGIGPPRFAHAPPAILSIALRPPLLYRLPRQRNKDMRSGAAGFPVLCDRA